MINDLEIIFKVYLISLGLQFLVWPWVSKWFKGLLDGGWALGRVLSLLAISLPVWFGGHLLPMNTDVGVMMVILGLVLTGLRTIQRSKQTGSLQSVGNLEPSYACHRKAIWIEEGLFLLGLLGLSLIRGFQPDILGLEKFMDFGFIKQYLISNKLPVNDMWLAKETINYYSFGHFLTSILVRIWGVKLEIGYNLMLAWILGTSLALSFSIIVNLLGISLYFGKTRKKEGHLGERLVWRAVLVGGVMGALLTCLGGNSHALWYLVKNKGFVNYWYADATRFIANTIHEFPGYSFVVSDLHAHVLGLPISLAFILVLISRFAPSIQQQATRGSKLSSGVIQGFDWVTEPPLISGVILGVFLGVMVMTNTWDVAIYSLLLIVFSLLLLAHKRIGVKELLVLAGVIIGVAGITALPWVLNFKFFSDGIRVTNERSPLWQMGVLWGGHIVIVLIMVMMSTKIKVKNEKLLLVQAMGVTALLLLLIPELVYVKDIYTTHKRANTMFKLTYQAFILMSLIFGWVVGWLYSIKTTHHKLSVGLRDHFWQIGMILLWGGLMLFPPQAFNSYYEGFKKYKGLDGLSWLKRNQDKWGMIEYLEKNRDGKNLVEAVGSSYSQLNSISAFSGTPTVLGWRVHEWLWRGGYTVVGERDGKVRDFYENGDKKILEDFRVGWIVIGPDERKEYTEIDEDRILNLGKVVWAGKKSYLVKVDEIN